MLLKRLQKPVILFFSLSFFVFVTYLTLYLKIKVDFTSFYLSFREFLVFKNPFLSHALSFISSTSKISVNLNTPFFVLLFSPLATIIYPKAFIIWQFISILCLIAGVRLTAKHAGISLHKFMLGVCFSYPILMNFFIGQIGAIIFFFVILGYDLLKSNKVVWAGLSWGFITGIKLFPGLLLFYAFREKQYKLCAVFCLTLFLTLVLPYIVCGPEVYQSYFQALKNIKWYKHVWNASFLGFTSRILDIDTLPFLSQNSISYLTCALQIGLFSSYLYLISTANKNIRAQSFNITIIYMVLLSPLGWFYYFTLLLIPVSYQLRHFNKLSIFRQSIFLFGLFLLMFPKNAYGDNSSLSLLYELTFGSQYFYGLVWILLVTLLNSRKKIDLSSEPIKFEVFKLCLVSFLYLITAYFFLVNLAKIYIFWQWGHDKIMRG